jgi:thioester reductase-like protein
MLSSHNKLHQLSPQDTVLFNISMSFDLSVAQIWGSLTSGAIMALSTQETTQDPTKLAHFMRKVGVTVTYFTPTQFALLLAHGREDLAECSKYRSAIFCGEHLPIRLVKAIYDLKTPVTVYNQWGPTEATVQTSSHKTSYPNDLDLNLPIGFPIPNCSHYIVDRNMKPVPASVVGEICIGGAQVGLGYINLPDITAKAFMEDPFASNDFRTQGWTRMYKTGDRGRFLSDGQMDFKGRISGDKQIKLRGFRIDLADIENEIHLASKRSDALHVVDVAVLPRKRDSGEFNSLTDDRELIAFIVPSKPCTKAAQQEMVNALHGIICLHLNDYMLPCGYQFMDALPSLVSSKTDRQVLLESKLDLVFASSVIKIEGEIEDSARAKQEVLSSVITVFRQVLNVPETRKIQPNDRIFDIGGSSLLLVRLRAVLKRKFSVDIPVAELFHQPTPLGITEKIVHHRDPDPNGSRKISWTAETALPNEERYYPKPELSSIPSSDPTDILITGVESFVGINMLATLLSASRSTTIHVMGSQKKMTLSDLAQMFEEWRLFNASLDRTELQLRTRCVPGMLADAKFGLTCQDFKRLGRTIQSIYHLGGQVSLLKTYTDIKRMNVDGTLDIIELAGLGLGLTKIHYLSTWSVPHLQTWSITKRTWNTIDLSESPPSHYQPGGGDKFGYFKSRWVAEMLLCEAAKRKFLVTIYRSSAITAGTTQSAQSAMPDNFTTNMILNMIKLGCVPEFNHPSSSFATSSFVIDLIPVDYLTSVLTALSTSDFSQEDSFGSGPKYYHITNPAPLALQGLPALIAQIRSDGVAGSTVTVSEWKRLMRNRGSGSSNDVERSFQQMEWNVFEEYLDLGHAMLLLEVTKTRAALEKFRGNASKSGITPCPPVDETYLGNLFRSQNP